MNKLPELKIKNSAKINGAHFYPEIVRIINTARATAPETTDGVIWITSGSEDASSSGRLVHSLHYKDKAIDFRINNLKDGHPAARSWSAKIALACGADYDIVLKSNHIHCEYDPETNPEI